MIRGLCAAAGLLASAAAAQELPVFDPFADFEIIGVDDMRSAIVVSEGDHFLCNLNRGTAAATLSDCIPLVTREEWDRIEAERTTILESAFGAAVARIDEIDAAFQGDPTLAERTWLAFMRSVGCAFQAEDYPQRQMSAFMMPFLEAEAGLAPLPDLEPLRGASEYRDRIQVVDDTLEFRMMDYLAPTIEDWFDAGSLTFDEATGTVRLEDGC